VTATAPHPHTGARSFAVRGLAWSLGLFGLVRLGWIESHAILPLTALQASLARAAFGAPSAPINVTLACSGADALALCAGAVLAYPAPWRTRLWGAVAGVALVLAVNVLRIGTLGRAASSPQWFQVLHVYVWPAILTVAVAGYVFVWMRTADAPARRMASPAASSDRTTRFVWLAGALLLVFTAAPLVYADNAIILAVTSFIARAAAVGLRALGLEAGAAGSVLLTARGAFLVTPECVATPLIPVYLAAVWSYAGSASRRTLGIIAAIPLFVALGVARLLVVAVPAALIGSPLFLIHAFYQLLLGAVVVCAAAVWRHGVRPAAWRATIAGGAAGAALMYALGAGFGRMLAALAGAAPLEDPQGAIAFLPAFQVGLYVALSIAVGVAAGWRALAGGLLLVLSQVALLAAVPLVQHAGFSPHVRDVRGWAVAAPLLLLAGMVRYAPARR
jgi:exosortase/archaeosortase family protein